MSRYREKSVSLFFFCDDSWRYSHLNNSLYGNNGERVHVWNLSIIDWRLFVRSQLFVLRICDITVNLINIKMDNNQEKHQRSLCQMEEKRKEGEIYQKKSYVLSIFGLEQANIDHHWGKLRIIYRIFNDSMKHAV